MSEREKASERERERERERNRRVTRIGERGRERERGRARERERESEKGGERGTHERNESADTHTRSFPWSTRRVGERRVLVTCCRLREQNSKAGNRELKDTLIFLQNCLWGAILRNVFRT